MWSLILGTIRCYSILTCLREMWRISFEFGYMVLLLYYIIVHILLGIGMELALPECADFP